MADALALAVAFDLLSGLIALLVSYFAFQARRLVESPVLSAISFGFMLLGAGLLVEGATNLSLGLTAADVTQLRTIELLENLAYLLLQVLALVVIAVGYAKVAYGRIGPAAALPGVVAFATASATRAGKLAGLLLLLYYLFVGLEFLVLLILVFIIFQGLLIYSRSKSGSSLLVLVGFSLFFVGHLIVLHSILAVSGVEYLVAAATQFLGFLSMLAFVIRSGRIGPT